MSDRDNHGRFKKALEEKQDQLQPHAVSMAPEIRDVPLETVEPRRMGMQDEQFPTAGLSAAEEQDKIMEAKLQLQQPGKPGYTAFGKLEAKDSDFEWLQRKRAAAEAANFQVRSSYVNPIFD